MKKFLILLLIVGIIIGLFFVTFSNIKESNTTSHETEKEETQQPKEVTDLSNTEKPASFANVPMTTYKSAEYGYEITYPEGWVGTLSPNIFGDKILEVYYLHPVEIPYGPPSLFDIKFRLGTAENFSNDMVDIYNLKLIKSNNLNGYKYTSGTEKNHTTTTYVLKIDAEHILTVIYWPNEAYDTTEEEAMWVLSTLKLTDD